MRVWQRGKMSYQHKIGVLEDYDPEATQIGNLEVVGQGTSAVDADSTHRAKPRSSSNDSASNGTPVVHTPRLVIAHQLAELPPATLDLASA